MNNLAMPFEVDAFSALLLVLVLGMGATVLSFATRSLRHEPYQTGFIRTGAALIGIGAVLATTTDLVILALAWLATSLLTVRLVRFGPTSTATLRSTRVRRAFAVSDGAVIIAIAILAAQAGSSAIADVDPSGAAGAAAGLLLVIAALARSAAIPFHRWLPDTLGAPTPSSALLHAGVVNGGAILLIKLVPAVAPNLWVAIPLVIVAGASCVMAEAVMLTRPDVKGRLAWSTTAQMSFTLVLCGLGLTTAAALHLVAHGMYKGALFLGSGGAVRSIVRSRTAPPVAALSGPASAAVTTVAFATTGAAAAAAIVAVGASPTADLLVPVGLAWVAGACALRAWLHRTLGPVTAGRSVAANRSAAGGMALGAGAVAAFTLATIVLKAWVAPAIVEVDAGLHPAWIAVVLALLAAVALTPTATATPRRWPVINQAWEAARLVGRPTPPAPLPIRGGATTQPGPAVTATPNPAFDPRFNGG